MLEVIILFREAIWVSNGCLSIQFQFIGCTFCKRRRAIAVSHFLAFPLHRMDFMIILMAINLPSPFGLEYWQWVQLELLGLRFWRCQNELTLVNLSSLLRLKKVSSVKKSFWCPVYKVALNYSMVVSGYIWCFMCSYHCVNKIWIASNHTL